MNQIIFTRYVADLCADRSPSDEWHEEIRQALERRIRRELMQRSLWSAPPSYLGFFGDASWFRKPRGPLDELTAECYTAIFLERLERLCAHLKLKANVDGLVHRNVRNYIHDLQQRHDPLGTRIYHLVHGAVRDLVESGDLWVADGPERVSNATVLAFSRPEADEIGEIDEIGEAGEMESLQETLREQVVLWCEDLMPTLVITRGRGLSRMRDELRQRILTLPAADLAAFRFQDLVQTLKQIARGRWGTAMKTEQGGEATGTARYTFEDRQSFRHLLDCVERELEALEEAGEEQRLEDLRAVWDLLVAWAADHPEEADPPLDPERTPSRRQISKVLDLPRDRLTPLYEKLGKLIQACHAPGVPGVPGAEDRKEASMAEDRRTARRQAGALTLIRAAAAWEGEWVLLEPTDDGGWWIAPVDDHPLAGPGDLRLGRRTVRCGLALPAPAALLEDDLFLEPLNEAEAEALQNHHRAVQQGTHRPTLKQQEAELAPEYQDWLEEGPRPAHAAVREAARFAAPREQSPASPVPPTPRPHWSAAAAALFALLTVGLGYQLWQAQRELAKAEVQLVAPEESQVTLGEEQRSAARWVLKPGEPALAVEVSVRKDFGCRNYSLELRKGERTLWVSETVNPDETIRFTVSRAFLEKRPTELVLYGVCAGEREELEPVKLTVVLEE